MYTGTEDTPKSPTPHSEHAPILCASGTGEQCLGAIFDMGYCAYFLTIGNGYVIGIDAFQLFQWQTTWDRSKLFTSIKPNPPIPFGSPSQIGQADIDIDDTSTFQSVWGFGGSLSLFLCFLIIPVECLS